MISLELVDPRYYHLDTCFCPLTPGMAIYYPPAFDDYGQRALREVVNELIPVVESEAWNFACNAVVVGRTVITNAGCPELHRELAIARFHAHRHAAGRVRQIGRIGQVPHLATGRRGSGGVEVRGKEELTTKYTKHTKRETCRVGPASLRCRPTIAFLDRKMPVGTQGAEK